MNIKKLVSVIVLCSFVFLQPGCAVKNRDATGEEVALGLTSGAVVGAIIGASTPATLAGALLGTIFGIAVINLSDEEVVTVLDAIEAPDDAPTVVEQAEATYTIRPVNTYAVIEDSRTVWCRDATIQRLSSLDQETIQTKICRDDSHWFIQNI